MPSYKFKCLACGHEETAILAIAERETGAPSHCKEKMTRVLVPPPVQYFGKGFSKNGE